MGMSGFGMGGFMFGQQMPPGAFPPTPQPPEAMLAVRSCLLANGHDIHNFIWQLTPIISTIDK